jgi:hypothetical protein
VTMAQLAAGLPPMVAARPTIKRGPPDWSPE